jgi:hypothetical protein
MKQNKILNTAILAALAMGSGNGQAADPTFEMVFPFTGNCDGDNTGLTFVDEPISVAMESVGSDGIDTAGATICTRYTTGIENGLDEMFYITYTLSGGEWSGDPSTSDFKISASTTPGLSGSGGDETTTKFLVTPDSGNSIGPDNPLFFTFTLAELADTLQEENGVVNLEAELLLALGEKSLEKPDSLDLMKSVMGTKVIIDASTEEVKIDVAQSGMKFTGSSYGELTASLGTVAIQDNDLEPEPKFYNTTDGWKTWSMDENRVSEEAGTLKITNGPFAASLGDHDPDGEPSSYFVFLSPGCGLTESAVPATEIEDESTARWDLTRDQIKDVIDSEEVEICVRVPETNSTQINETKDPPESDFLINYDKRDNLAYSKTRLLHIKRNGTVCSLYNVPSESGNDIVNIRVTNLTNREGILTGQLKDKDGNPLIEGELDLLSLSGGTLPPYATIRLTGDKLKELLIAAGHETGIWKGRAVLTISSDLTKMEVFGLLRNKGVDNSPLLNMSVGGTGSGCD